MAGTRTTRTGNTVRNVQGAPGSYSTMSFPASGTTRQTPGPGTFASQYGIPFETSTPSSVAAPPRRTGYVQTSGGVRGSAAPDYSWMNPSGGGGGGYGGSGGGGGPAAPPGIDQATFDGIIGMLSGTTPQTYQYQNLQLSQLPQFQQLDLPEYTGTGFYDFDSSPYDQALSGIETGIADASKSGHMAFDNMAAAYGSTGNPYAQGPKVASQVDPRLLASMEAFSGAGADAAAQTQFEGAQADAAMASVYDLLGASGEQYRQNMVNSVMGDRAQFDQNMASQQNMMNLSVNMALAAAKSQYEKDKWQYGEQIAQQNYQAAVQEAMFNTQGQNDWAMANNSIANQQQVANNQGVNAANAANVGAFNDWVGANTGSIIDLILAGIDPNTGQQTLTLDNPFHNATAPQMQTVGALPQAGAGGRERIMR